MTTTPANPNAADGLTITGCRARQERLRAAMHEQGLDAVLLTNQRHVHYFTAYWARSVFPVAAVVTAGGPTVVATAFPSGSELATDESVAVPAALHATLVEDPQAAAITAVLPALGGARVVGVDEPTKPWLLADREVRDAWSLLLGLRRRKDPDEIALLGRAVVSAEAGYARARELLARPGSTELELFAAIQLAVVEAAGEPIGELGNDFRSGEMGGPPRRRQALAGELLPLDLGVPVRGYHADLCRTFCVGAEPTRQQALAHALVVETLDALEASIRPGSSCRAAYATAFDRLDGRHGWRFPHHLGHGVGLAAHEAPRLNPNWDDEFRVGDVFTLEPGLYGDGLNAGVRIEEEYRMTEQGPQRLSSFPRDLR